MFEKDDIEIINLRVENERLKRWLLYFTACQASTLEDIERRSGTSMASRNRHRGLLDLMLRAVDGKAFDRYANKPESDERIARDVAARFPYLPALDRD